MFIVVMSASLVVLVAGSWFLALHFLGSIFAGTVGERKPLLPNASGPPLDQVNASLSLADRFLSGLYRPLDGSDAVVSEYYAFPLRTYLRGYDRWMLAGEDKSVCHRRLCSKTTSIIPVRSDADGEAFSVDFRTPQAPSSPRLKVEINWNADSGHYLVSVVNEAFVDKATVADVYLGAVYVGSFSEGNVGSQATLRLDKSDPSFLRSLRYTIRHGVQEGENYYRYVGQSDRADRLSHYLRDWGFQSELDLRAPIWGQGSTYPDDMPYSLTVYHDCFVRIAETAAAYPYESRICRVGPRAYIVASKNDTLSPAIEAIHLLNKYHDPHWSRGEPLRTAQMLEQKFNLSGVGVPKCLGPPCAVTEASSVRTFQFGALETLLGYRYGDAISRSYADAAARIALQVQVPEDGVVQTDRGAFYRPIQAGGFYEVWNSSFRFPLKSSWYDLLMQPLTMPPEYRGLIPSNSETSLDAYAFLALYKCARFGACSPLPASTACCAGDRAGGALSVEVHEALRQLDDSRRLGSQSRAPEAGAGPSSPVPQPSPGAALDHDPVAVGGEDPERGAIPSPSTPVAVSATGKPVASTSISPIPEETPEASLPGSGLAGVPTKSPTPESRKPEPDHPGKGHDRSPDPQGAPGTAGVSHQIEHGQQCDKGLGHAGSRRRCG